MKKHLKVVLLSCLVSFVNIATAQMPVSDSDDSCLFMPADCNLGFIS